MPVSKAVDGDDNALFRAAQRGDRQAIEQQVDAHWHRAWRASMSVLLDSHRAEDHPSGKCGADCSGPHIPEVAGSSPSLPGELSGIASRSVLTAED